MNSLRTEWVIGAFTGERAKSVKAHADAGLGYFIQQEAGAGQNYTVTAAFRRPTTSARSESLQLVSMYQEKKLEELKANRDGKILSRQ